MRVVPKLAKIIGCGAVLAALATVAAIARQQQAQTPAPKPAEQVYKNIKVLQGVPADQIIPSMHVISDALAVDCEYCHVEGDFPSDRKDTKQTARDMYEMMSNINKTSFSGKQVVTCYTCHHGNSEPVTMSVLPESTAMLPHMPQPQQAATALPSVDAILGKYVQALGGEQAIRKITSRAVTGTRDLPTGPGGSVGLPAQFERYDQAPALNVTTYRTPAGTLSEGFDGTTAWTQDAKGVVTVAPAVDQARARRNGIRESLELKQQYSRIAVRGIQSVNGHDAYLVVGFPPGENPERLYFDTQTGLLVRKITSLPTPAGDSPFQVDYGDYRDTGSGVKFPFLMHMVPASPRSAFCSSCDDFSQSTIRVQKVQDNLPVDAGKFVAPASRTPAAQ